MRFILIKKKWLMLTVLAVAIGAGLYVFQPQTITTGVEQASGEEHLEFNMVIGEFSSTAEDGTKREAYRFDPGTIFIPKDKKVTLSIYGVNGKEHPFMIEGTDIKGIVKKGEETKVNLHFKEEGIYRLVCLSHSHIEHNGPMVAYLVVK